MVGPIAARLREYVCPSARCLRAGSGSHTKHGGPFNRAGIVAIAGRHIRLHVSGERARQAPRRRSRDDTIATPDRSQTPCSTVTKPRHVQTSVARACNNLRNLILVREVACTGMAAALLPDPLWDLVEPSLPIPPRRPQDGRPCVSDRACLTGIVFVLRIGIPWQMLPQELGCGSGMTWWRRLRDWQQAGVWDLIHFGLLDWLARDDLG
jgi:transposase